MLGKRTRAPLTTESEASRVERRFHGSIATIHRRLRQVGGVPAQTTPLQRPDVEASVVAEGRRSGLTLPQLVARFRCSVLPILERLRDAGVALRLTSEDRGLQVPLDPRQIKRVPIPATLLGGASSDRICSTLRCGEQTVHQRLVRAGLSPTRGRREGRRPDVTREAVTELRAQGFSVESIARRLGCSPHVVEQRLRPG
jgi:hypothetical protein